MKPTDDDKQPEDRSVEGVHHGERHDEEIEHERRGRDAPAPGDSEPIEGEGDRGLDGFK